MNKKRKESLIELSELIKQIYIEEGPRLTTKFYGVRLRIDIEQEKDELANTSNLYFRMYAQSRLQYPPTYYYPSGTITVNGKVLQASFENYYTFDSTTTASHRGQVNDGGMNPIVQYNTSKGKQPPWVMKVQHNPDGSLPCTIKYEIGGAIESRTFSPTGTTICSGSTTFNLNQIPRKGILNLIEDGVLSHRSDKKPLSANVYPYSSNFNYEFYYALNGEGQRVKIPTTEYTFQGGVFKWDPSNTFLGASYATKKDISGELYCVTNMGNAHSEESSIPFRFIVGWYGDAPTLNKQIIVDKKFDLNNFFKEKNELLINNFPNQKEYILNTSKIGFIDLGNSTLESPTSSTITKFKVSINNKALEQVEPTTYVSDPIFFDRISLELTNSRGFTYNISGNLPIGNYYQKPIISKFIENSIERNPDGTPNKLIFKGNIIANSKLLNKLKISVKDRIEGDLVSNWPLPVSEADNYFSIVIPTKIKNEKDKQTKYKTTIVLSDGISSTQYEVTFMEKGSFTYMDMKAFFTGWYVGQSLVRGVKIYDGIKATNAIGLGKIGTYIGDSTDPLLIKLSQASYGYVNEKKLKVYGGFKTGDTSDRGINEYLIKPGTLVEINCKIPDGDIFKNWFCPQNNKINGVDRTLQFVMPNRDIEIIAHTTK